MAGQEVQVAVLGGSTDVTVQAAAVAAFADATRKAGVSEAPPIESLAEVIPLGDLPSESGGRPVIGVASSSLEPHGFDPKGTFIITGPSGSGRTTALAATAAALHRFSSASELHLMTPRRQSELLDLGVWAETAVGGEAATALATPARGRHRGGAHHPARRGLRRARRRPRPGGRRERADRTRQGVRRQRPARRRRGGVGLLHDQLRPAVAAQDVALGPGPAPRRQRGALGVQGQPARPQPGRAAAGPRLRHREGQVRADPDRPPLTPFPSSGLVVTPPRHGWGG